MLSPYLLSENDDYSYEFVTEKGIKYFIYFLDYSFMFHAYPQIAEKIYSFNIEVAEGKPFAVTDERIGITVVEAFRIFFDKIDNAAVYVCDSIDSRQLARKRKFDYWFWKYNDGSILKEDGLAVTDGVEILNSLLIHKQNPRLAEIILAYKAINERSDNK